MNQLDKIFKHKLEHYHADFPSDAWDKIEARLPQAKKSNRFFWPIMSLVLVLVVAGSTAFYFNDSEVQTEQNKSTSNPNILAQAASDIIKNELNEQTIVDITHTESVLSPQKNYKAKNGLNIYTSTKSETTSLDKENQHEHIGHNVSLQPEALNPRVPFEIEAIDNVPLNTFTNSPSNKLKFVTAFGGKEPVAKACPFVLNARDKSIDVYYSSDFSRKSISGPESLDSYKGMRNETELPMYSFSAGFRFGYNLSYRWNLHTGVNYSQINEKFRYIDPESNSTRVITIKDYIYDNGRIVDSIVKEETVIVPGTTIHTVYNKIRTLDIPILARYTLMANKHMSLSAVSGVFINVASYQKGMILSHVDNKPMDVLQENADGNTMYKTNVGISLYGGLSVAYHLSGNTDFLLEPHYRWQTESMTHESYPLDQKINTFGLTTGLRYKF
jgi:hypothetical protein